jgi:hypothetical protein
MGKLRRERIRVEVKVSQCVGLVGLLLREIILVHSVRVRRPLTRTLLTDVR